MTKSKKESGSKSGTSKMSAEGVVINVVQIPQSLFTRMSKALIAVEKVLGEQSEEWVSEERALELLGCKRTKLFSLKDKGEIRYKKVGRINQYSKKSIEKYNGLISS